MDLSLPPGQTRQNQYFGPRDLTPKVTIVNLINCSLSQALLGIWEVKSSTYMRTAYLNSKSRKNMDRILRIVEHKVERVTPFLTVPLQTASYTTANNRHWAADLFMILAFLSSSDSLEMNWVWLPTNLWVAKRLKIRVEIDYIKAAIFVAMPSALELQYIKLSSFQ